MPTDSGGYSGEYIPEWLRTSVLGAQTEEQGRYQAGLQPYRQQAEYYEPGGEFAQQMPSYLYSSFIQPFVGGTGGALRNLFSTTRAGQISMKAAQEAELMRGQQYSSAMGALGEATQRYPMMPNLVGLNESQYYSWPSSGSSGPYINPNNASGGGGSSGGGGGDGSSSGSGGTGSSSGGGTSSGGGGASSGALPNESLWMHGVTGAYSWGDYSGANSWWFQVGGWDKLQELMQQNPNLNVANMPTTNVDPNTGQVSYQ